MENVNDIIDLGLETKIGVKATKYLNEPTKDNLDEFKNELEISSYMALTALIEKLLKQTQKVEYCKVLINLILPKFSPEEEKISHYDPMLGEIIDDDEVSKKMNM